MEVRLFGEREAEHAGVPVPVRGVKQRALLALLALHRGHPVSADRLIEVLWGDGQAAHPAAYASSYRQAPLWLSRAELAGLPGRCAHVLRGSLCRAAGLRLAVAWCRGPGRSGRS